MDDEDANAPRGGGDAESNGASRATATADAEAAAAEAEAEAEAARRAAAKRRSIQAIMRDTTLTDLEKRLRVQQLMDGSLDASADDRSPSAAADSLTTSLLSLRPDGGASPTAGGGGDAPGNDSDDRGEETAAPCVHYDRKCNVVAPCCGRVFGCRVCHDDMSPACGPMDRFAIQWIVCKECNTRQPSK